LIVTQDLGSVTVDLIYPCYYGFRVKLDCSNTGAGGGPWLLVLT